MFSIFDRHHGTQRFFFMIFLCLAIMIGLTGYGVVVQHQNSQVQISSTPVYTGSYTWSRTSDRGSVEGFFVSSDRTKAYLLLHNTGTKSSSQATEYQVFMSGMDEPLDSAGRECACTVYSYGMNGYVGFLFVNASGFKSQRYSLIIRNDSAASLEANESTFDPNRERDISFQDHNQVRIVVNFAATGATVLPAMDDEVLDPVSIISDSGISVGYESGVQVFDQNVKNAQNQLSIMSECMVNIAQLRSELSSAGITVPDLPWYMAGDVVNNIPNDFTREVTYYTEDMLERQSTGSGTDYGDGDGGAGSSSSGSSSGGGSSSSASGSGAASSSGGGSSDLTGDVGTGATYVNGDGVEVPYFYLHTDYLFPGRVHFQWQGRRLSQGMISQVGLYPYPAGTQLYEMYSDYQTWRDEYLEAEGASTLMPVSVSYRDDEWRYVETNAKVDLQATGPLPERIKSYTETVNKYLKAKETYFGCLSSILDYEYSLQNMRTTGMSSFSGPTYGGSTAQDENIKPTMWVY